MIGGHATVGRLSSNAFRRFKQLGKILKKSLNGHATVVGGHATISRLSKTSFWRSSDLEKFWKMSLNGHATVVGGHATVDRLSNEVFRTFQAIRKFFEKSHWTVTRQWSEVTRLSKNVFGRSKQYGKISKKVTERSRNSGRRSRVRRPTVKQRLWTFQAIWKFFEKCLRTVTRQWSKITRFSADCQKTFFGRFKQFGKILKKVTERSRDSGRRSRDRRPTVKPFRCCCYPTGRLLYQYACNSVA